MHHSWTDVMQSLDPATASSLGESFEHKFGVVMERCPEHLVSEGWDFVMWYLEAYRGLPPGNRVLDGDGNVVHPSVVLGPNRRTG